MWKTLSFDVNSSHQISTLNETKSKNRDQTAWDQPLRLGYNSKFGFGFKQIIKTISEVGGGGGDKDQSIPGSSHALLPSVQKQAQILPYRRSYLTASHFCPGAKRKSQTGCPSQPISADKTLASDPCCGWTLCSKMVKSSLPRSKAAQTSGASQGDQPGFVATLWGLNISPYPLRSKRNLFSCSVI